MKKRMLRVYFDIRILGPHLIVPFSGVAAVAAYLSLISRSFTLVPFEFFLPLFSVWTGIFLIEPMLSRGQGELLWSYPVKTVSRGLYPLCRTFLYNELLLFVLCGAVGIWYSVEWENLLLLLTVQSLFMNTLAFFLLVVSGESSVPLFGCVLYQLASWTLREIFPEHLSIYFLRDALPEITWIFRKGLNMLPIAAAFVIAGASLFSYRNKRGSAETMRLRSRYTMRRGT